MHRKHFLLHNRFHITLTLKQRLKERGTENFVDKSFCYGCAFFRSDKYVDFFKVCACSKNFFQNYFAEETSTTCNEDRFVFVELSDL